MAIKKNHLADNLLYDVSKSLLIINSIEKVSVGKLKHVDIRLTYVQPLCLAYLVSHKEMGIKTNVTMVYLLEGEILIEDSRGTFRIFLFSDFFFLQSIVFEVWCDIILTLLY